MSWGFSPLPAGGSPSGAGGALDAVEYAAGPRPLARPARTPRQGWQIDGLAGLGAVAQPGTPGVPVFGGRVVLAATGGTVLPALSATLTGLPANADARPLPRRPAVRPLPPVVPPSELLAVTFPTAWAVPVLAGKTLIAQVGLPVPPLLDTPVYVPMAAEVPRPRRFAPRDLPVAWAPLTLGGVPDLPVRLPPRRLWTIPAPVTAPVAPFAVVVDFAGDAGDARPPVPLSAMPRPWEPALSPLLPPLPLVVADRPVPTRPARWVLPEDAPPALALLSWVQPSPGEPPRSRGALRPGREDGTVWPLLTPGALSWVTGDDPRPFPLPPVWGARGSTARPPADLLQVSFPTAWATPVLPGRVVFAPVGMPSPVALAAGLSPVEWAGVERPRWEWQARQPRRRTELVGLPRLTPGDVPEATPGRPRSRAQASRGEALTPLPFLGGLAAWGAAEDGRPVWPRSARRYPLNVWVPLQLVTPLLTRFDGEATWAHRRQGRPYGTAVLVFPAVVPAVFRPGPSWQWGPLAVCWVFSPQPQLLWQAAPALTTDAPAYTTVVWAFPAARTSWEF